MVGEFCRGGGMGLGIYDTRGKGVGGNARYKLEVDGMGIKKGLRL